MYDHLFVDLSLLKITHTHKILPTAKTNPS